jgi:HK97 family phage major capsid protein
MRTLAQIAAEMQPLVKKIEDLLGDETKSVTDAEMTEVETLQAQVDTLQAEYDQVKKVSDARGANASRKSLFNTPAPVVKHAQGNGGNDSAPVAEFPLSGSLKHFTGANAQEANMKAYRFGQFLKGYVLNPVPGTGPAAEWCKANGIEYKAAQAEGTIADGGALVPQEFERTLIDLREMYGTFRPNAKTEPMASETKLIPRRTGGLTAYFVGEAAAATTSAKSFDLVQLTAKKLMALVPYSTEIAEDAIINLADDLAGEIAYAFALKEDQCGWLGDGTSTYGGITGVTKKILNLSATMANIAGVKVQTGTGSFSGAVLADFQGTIAKLPKYADTPRAKWYMHKSFYHAIPGALMAAAGGNNISDIQGGVRKPTFLGYPVEFVQVLPTVWAVDTVFALFGDLSLAASFGDRRATTLFTDPYSLSANDQVQIRGTERFDINVHDVGNASGTAASRVPGPIVAFVSAAS